jgi:autotransporter passenger strand-loop-strand repeat protein
MTDYVVSSGQVTSGLVLNAGDTETVLSGGVAFATTVEDR